jgi:hypothetical protein
MKLFTHDCLHGAYLVQDNEVERYVFIENDITYLYSPSTKTTVPVIIKVTGRKDIWHRDEWTARVKVLFLDNQEDLGTIFWSLTGNENRIGYLNYEGIVKK